MPKKIAIVTGGAARVGREISEYLLSNNWQVIIFYHRSEGEALAIQKLYPQAIIMPIDLAVQNDYDQIISDLTQQHGELSLLINNAAIFTNDHALQLDTKILYDHMQVNFFSPLLLSCAFAKKLEGGEGNVINIIDAQINKYHKNFFSYQLSKASLLQATKKLALQLAPFCRVNAICPGYISRRDDQNEERFSELVNSTPLKIVSQMNEICQAINFILESASVTGAEIVIDGGLQL